jgi:hypothetical protein
MSRPTNSEEGVVNPIPRVKYVDAGYQLTQEELAENRARRLVVVCKLRDETDEEAWRRLWGTRPGQSPHNQDG